MRYITVLVLFFIFIGNTLLAQNEGRVVYEKEVKFELPKKAKDNPKMKAMMTDMPKSFKTKYELSFTTKESLYKNVKEEEDVSERKGGFFFVSMDAPDDVYYHNKEENKNLHQRDFFRKTFLVSGELEKRKWKITKEQRIIEDYLCIKAVSGDSTEQVTAWFSPQIPTSFAPQFLEGLPGLILAAQMNEGKTTLFAKEITIGKLKEKIKAPKEGKKVTKEKYDKIVKEKKEEMKNRFRKRRGGDDGFIIISD